MEQREYDLILNEWKIYDEAERWSIKRLFLQEYGNKCAINDFVKFLTRRFGKPSLSFNRGT